MAERPKLESTAEASISFAVPLTPCSSGGIFSQVPGDSSPALTLSEGPQGIPASPTLMRAKEEMEWNPNSGSHRATNSELCENYSLR